MSIRPVIDGIAVYTAIIAFALALFSSCSGCIGIVDFGDPGPGRPVSIPSEVSP